MGGVGSFSQAKPSAVLDFTGMADCFSRTLTTGSDVPALTVGSDTINATTSGLLGSAGTNSDVIVDSSSSDTDILNATVTSAALAPTMSKIEVVNISGQFAATGLDLTNVTATKTLNLSNAIVNGTATVAAAKISAAEKIVAGANVGTLNITADATAGTGGSLTVDAGSATAVAFTAAAATDTVALTVNGDIAVTGGAAIETATINATRASVVTLDAIGTSLAVTGVGDVTVKTAIANLDAETVTKSMTSGAVTVNATGNAAASLDFSKIAANTIKLSGTIGANTITVASGQVVSLDVDAGNAASTITAAAATAGSNTVTVNTKTGQTGLVFTQIKTVNLVSAATQVAGLDATYAVVDASTNNVTLAGTNDVKVTLGTAKNFDASGLNGYLHYLQAAAADTTVKGGTGGNIIVLEGTTHTNSYTGQNGGDTVTVKTTTGSGTVVTGSGNDAITVSGLTTGTVSLTLGDGVNTVTNSAITATTGVLNVVSGSGIDTVTSNALTTGTLAGSLGAGNDTVSATGLTSGALSVDLGDGDDSVTVGGVTTGIVNITGGNGTDTLKAATATTFAAATLSLNGVEKILLTNAGSMTFSAAQMTGKTFTLQGSGTSSDHYKVTEGTNAGATIDLSGLVLDATLANSIAGVSITGGNGVDAITGTAGADTINGGTGADSIIFAATGSANGTDVLTVVAGAGGDILNFKNFLSGGAVAQGTGTGTAIVAYEHNATGDVAIAGKAILLASADSGVVAVDTAAEVAALIDGAGNALSITAGGKAVIVAGDDSAATAGATIYYVYDSNGDGLVSGSGEVKAVGTMTLDIDTLVTGNFAFA
jgi:hypothetical protein